MVEKRTQRPAYTVNAIKFGQVFLKYLPRQDHEYLQHKQTLSGPFSMSLVFHKSGVLVKTLVDVLDIHI